jgi:phage terminase small subunit
MGGKNDSIKKEYLKLQGNINLKDLATKYDIKYATLRSLKSRDKWDQELKEPRNTTKNIDKNVDKPQKTKKERATPVLQNATVDNMIKNDKGKADQRNNDSATVLEEIESVATLQMNLTKKQILFCQEFCIDLNGSRAAIAAGYSKNSARSISCELLTKPNINAVIKQFQQCAMQDLNIDITKVIMEYASIAFSDITNYVDVGRKKITGLDKEGKKISSMSDYCHLKNGQLVTASTIQEIKISDQGTFIKMHDKHKALDFLVKFSGMASENAKQIEIQKLKLLQEKLKLEQKKGSLANDNGNIDQLINSITNIDLTVFDKKEGD